MVACSRCWQKIVLTTHIYTSLYSRKLQLQKRNNRPKNKGKRKTYNVSECAYIYEATEPIVKSGLEHYTNFKQFYARYTDFVRQHRMHEMSCGLLRSVIPCVCQSVSLSVMRLRYANTVERIDVLSAETLGGPKKHCVICDSRFPHRLDAAFVKLLLPLVSISTRLGSGA